MRTWPGVVAVCGCIGGVAVPIGGPHKSRTENQRSIMEEDFVPVALDYEPTWKQPVREVKVRVWADEKYRAENFHWEKAFDLQVEQVNAVLEPKLGIRLVVVQRTAWARQEPGSTLEEDLEALKAQDAGGDVFFVIGLVSAQSLVSATFDKMGIAYIGGRDLVVRGYADIEERKQFKNAFPDVPADEIDAALLARRKHKQTTLLLHELGHSLGANHEPQPDAMMNAGYSRMVTGYSSGAREAMLQGIEQRMHPELAGVQQVAAHHGANRVELAIISDGRVMHGDNFVQGAALAQMLEQAHRDDPDTEVVIRKHKSAPAAALQELVGKANAAGLQRVSVSPY
jgi:metallopeptidase family M12-like protein/biopolymer transport protein ExbD/TolR